MVVGVGGGGVGALSAPQQKKCSDTAGWPAAVSAASQAVPVGAALRAPAAAVLVVGHCGREDKSARFMPGRIKVLL